MAASLQGIDRLPSEDRSSQTALSLLDHVIRGMLGPEGPGLRPGDQLELQTLRSQLQDAVEGQNMWVEFPDLGDLVH